MMKYKIQDTTDSTSSSSIVIVSENLFSLLVSGMLGLLLVNEIETPGLDLAIDKGASESSKELLGQGVGSGLAVFCYVILVRLGSLEGSGTREQLMGNGSFVGGVTVLVVSLCLVRVAAKETHGMKYKSSVGGVGECGRGGWPER
jgi:hypothetical protein